MNITEKFLEEITDGVIEKEKINIFDFCSMGINKLVLSQVRFDFLEYLSLKNNQIRDLSFINSLPYLWYLDIRNNYIENFKVLEFKNTLGFLGFTLGKLFHTDFFTLKNINIAYLVIEGDYEEKGRHEQFLLNESNNIIFFKDNVILFKNKLNSKYFDIENFMGSENYEFGKPDFGENPMINFEDQENKRYANMQKIKKMESFLKNFNSEMRNILKTNFKIQPIVFERKFERKRSLRKRFTTVVNPQVGNIFSKLNGDEKKTVSTMNMICINKNNVHNIITGKNENFGTESDVIKNKNENYSNFEKKSSPRKKDSIFKNKAGSLFDKELGQTDKLYGQKDENFQEINLENFSEVEIYNELERQKLKFLFDCFDSFINIEINNDNSNIISGFDINQRSRKSIFKSNTLITGFSNIYNSNLGSSEFSEKYKFNELSFFDNYKIFRSKQIKKNQNTKDNNKNKENSNVVDAIGFNYKILIVEDNREQIAILDILILHILGILKVNLVKKLLEILIIGKHHQISKETILKNINRLLLLNKTIFLGLVYSLVEIITEKANLNCSSIINNSSKSIFNNDLEIRRINKLAINVNNLKAKEMEFHSNFSDESAVFDKRKSSLFNLIKSIDKDFKIFDDLIIINQHIYDFILFSKIQDKIIEEDQFAYRVFLEFRNFLFEYKDKNIRSPNNKIFKSLADKQLLEYSSRNLANKFYFWKPNVKVRFELNKEDIKENGNFNSLNTKILKSPLNHKRSNSHVNHWRNMNNPSNNTIHGKISNRIKTENEINDENNKKTKNINSDPGKNENTSYRLSSKFTEEDQINYSNNLKIPVFEKKIDLITNNPPATNNKKLNFIINNNSPSSKIFNFNANLPKEIQYKIKSSNQLPLIINNDKSEKSENSTNKISENNYYNQGNKYFEKHNNNLSINSSNVLNNTIQGKNLQHRYSPTAINPQENIFNFDHKSTAYFLRETLIDMNSNHNKIGNLVMFGKEDKENNKFYNSNINFNKQNQKPIDIRSKIKRNSILRINNNGFSSKELKKVVFDKIDNNKMSCQTINKKIFNNLDIKNRVNFREDMHNSDGFDSNDDKEMSYREFYTKINIKMNGKNAKNLEPKIVDINNNNLNNNNVSINKISKEFFSRKKIILNKNKFRIIQTNN